MPTTTTALIIAVVLLVPGYVAQRRGEQTHNKRIERDGLRWTVLSLYYSMLVYAIVVLASAPFGADRDTFQAWARGDQEPWHYAAAALGVVALAYALAECERLWVTRDRTKAWKDRKRWEWRANDRHAITGAWDWVLGQAQPKFVIVTLKSGEEIGGYFGYDSFAAYSIESSSDLYIEDVIELADGWFVDEEDRSAPSTGIWIPRDEIRSIEFYPAPPNDKPTNLTVPTEDSDNQTEDQ